MKKAYYSIPALVVAFAVCAVFGIQNLVQIVRQESFSPVNRIAFHLMDYYDYYRASRQLFMPDSGVYSVQRYVTPPVAAVINYPLSKIPFRNAGKIIVFFMMISVCAVMYFSIKSFFPKYSDGPSSYIFNRVGIYSALTLIVLFSYPFYFLFDRGNIDWLVLLVVWGGVVMYKHKYSLPAGLLWGVGVCLKLYPVLLLIPVIVHRKWKVLAGMISSTAFFIAVCPGLWLVFLKNRILSRAHYFRIDENASLANTIYYLSKLLHLPLTGDNIFRFSIIIYGLLLLAMFITMLRRKNRGSFLIDSLLFVPFMLMIPHTVYAYELIFLIPMIPFYCYLWATQSTRQNLTTVVYIILFLGLIITQIQAVVWEHLIRSKLPHFLPSIGLFTVAVCSVFLINIYEHENNQ